MLWSATARAKGESGDTTRYVSLALGDVERARNAATEHHRIAVAIDTRADRVQISTGVVGRLRGGGRGQLVVAIVEEDRLSGRQVTTLLAVRSMASSRLRPLLTSITCSTLFSEPPAERP